MACLPRDSAASKGPLQPTKTLKFFGQIRTVKLRNPARFGKSGNFYSAL